MVYREPADELARQAAAAAAATGPLARLDVAGRDGVRGQDGAPGHGGESFGEDGRGGGGAGHPSQGEAGGTILLVVEPDAGRDHIAYLRGTIKSWRGEERADGEIDFDRSGEIELVATGGDGGDGGDGGRGGDGARGRRGSDASRYSSGGNGGAGGDGGDGGDGTSGAHGGAGGRIVVRVRDTDTHLLMLLARDVRGGDGGTAGDNGRGGWGGKGGDGGSSYSWTESESYTDSNGQSQSRSTSHSNSGGSDGRSGREGRSATAVLRDGSTGKEGAFGIEVLDPAARTTKYPSRYDVRLVSFRHRNDNDDGIYEPEEKVFVSHVEIENVGGMPTPSHHDIRIGLVDDGWIAPADARLKLPRSLAPGQRHVFAAEELALTLRVFRPQQSSGPLAAAETMRFFADLPDARRRFAHFETPASKEIGRLVIRFPVEASPLESLFSLAPGQAARIRWSITNVSEKALGRESGELGRAVSVYLGLARESRLGPESIHFIDDTGARIPLDVGFRREIPKIDPNETIAFEGTIAIDESATTYTTGRLFLAAELGHIEDPGLVRPIQYQEVSVTVGRPFDARDADVLFIANNRTTGEELAAWEELARSVGLSSAVWDASLEGGVAVLSAVARGERRYRLVVFLNNTMDTTAGEKRPSVLVDKATSLALSRIGTHVFYVGRSPDLDDLVIPTQDATSSTALLAADAEVEALLAACDAEPIGGDGVTIEVRTWYAWPWSVAKEEHLTVRARALAEDLEARWPDRRYVVVPRWDSAEEKKVAWIRIQRLGRLVVRRTLDPARAAVSGIEAKASAMHDPAFAAAPATLAALTAALPFEAKMKLLSVSNLPFAAKRPALEVGCSDVLVAAVLGDLVREQAMVGRFGWRASMEELVRAMPMLDAFSREAFPEAVDLGTDRGRRFVELMAWLELVARGHARWWEWMPPLVWLRRGTVLRSFVRDAIAAVVARAVGSGSGSGGGVEVLREAIANRVRELRAAWKSRKREYAAPEGAGDFALERLAAHVEGQPIENDALHLPPGARVIEGERIDALREKEQGRRGRSSEVVAGAAKARAELLRAETCQVLLARAGAGASASAGAEAGASAGAEAGASAGAGAGAGARPGADARVRVAVEAEVATVGDLEGLREEGEEEAPPSGRRPIRS